MPIDVREAFLEVISNGANINKAAAEDELLALERAGRYQTETWSWGLFDLFVWLLFVALLIFSWCVQLCCGTQMINLYFWGEMCMFIDLKGSKIKFYENTLILSEKNSNSFFHLFIYLFIYLCFAFLRRDEHTYR